jgi:hypothetical protein
MNVLPGHKQVQLCLKELWRKNSPVINQCNAGRSTKTRSGVKKLLDSDYPLPEVVVFRPNHGSATAISEV